MNDKLTINEWMNEWKNEWRLMNGLWVNDEW
jgi:hypothetical protein